jgi:hypothetical protein
MPSNDDITATAVMAAGALPPLMGMMRDGSDERGLATMALKILGSVTLTAVREAET